MPRISLAFLTAMLSLVVASLIGTVADAAESSEGAPAGLGVGAAAKLSTMEYWLM